MATRFAGDFFGIPLVSSEETNTAQLFSYFPELKSLRSTQTNSTDTQQDAGALLFGGAKAVKPFTGFKTFETSNEKKAAPLFAGFKTLQQPTRVSTKKDSDLQKEEEAQRKIAEGLTIDPEVLKVLGVNGQAQG